MLDITRHRGNENKRTATCHLTPVAMTSSENQQAARIGEDVEEGAPRAPLARSWIAAATVENGLQFPRKIKYGPAIQPLGIYVKRMKTHTEIHAPWGHCSGNYSSQDMEAASVPTHRRGDGEAVLRVRSGILLGHEKE